MMLPLVVLLAAGEPSGEPAYGPRTTADVRSVNPERERRDGDGAYGRFDGDLDLGLGAGGAAYFVTEDRAFTLRGTGHWYSTAGLYLSYAESLGDAGLERRAGFGIELEPLFLLRWSQALEQGPALLDLTLDSLSLGVGYTLAQAEGRGFGSTRGVELSLGFGVPLFAEAGGPWLEARGGWFLPASAREASVTVFLSWHFHLLSPVVRQ
jgi:hypothetical protein